MGADHFFGSNWSGVTNAEGYDTAAGYEADFTSEKQTGFNTKTVGAPHFFRSNWTGVTNAKGYDTAEG